MVTASARSARWRARNPLGDRAHYLVTQAARRGVLVRPAHCPQCGEAGRIEAHHADYARPLEVDWLYRRCHQRLHAALNAVHPATPNYVHALEVRGAQRLLFVAGTMGLDPEGVAGATLDHQLELVWNNIRTILAGANMTVDNIVRLTSYLRDASYAGANGAARCRALGDRRIPTAAIAVQTLSDDWLVEIEVIAAS